MQTLYPNRAFRMKGHTPGCACNWCHITRQRQRHDKLTQLTAELDKVREENARLTRTIQTLVKDMPQDEYITLVADSVAQMRWLKEHVADLASIA